MPSPRVSFLVALVASHSSIRGAPSIAFFVAPFGNDSNPGTSPSAPFSTLRAAQAALRSSLASTSMSSNATVSIFPGTYFEPAPLLFEPADSGANGFSVHWWCSDGSGAAATGCVLYVGTAIPGSMWTPFSANVYVANVSSLLPPAPQPPTPPSAPGCGLVEPGISYNGFDITEVLVPPNNLTACCDACASVPACTAWSLCVNITCGTPEKPINCYLKTSSAGRTPFGPLRTSGTLVNATPATAHPNFFTLIEGTLAATIARIPNRGSGYLSTLGVSNDDSSLTWPANLSSFPSTPFDVSNSHVFCNLGADWFTETRPVTSLNFDARTIYFEGRRNGVAGCNDKVYVQGPKEFIDEPGEWSFEPVSGLLYYWPFDPASLEPGSTTPVVASTNSSALQFLGSPGGGERGSARVTDIIVEGLEVRGSGFTPDGAYRVFPPGRPNDFPAPTDAGLVRVENAERITFLHCKLVHAGLSAVWVSRESRNVTVTGSWIEGPGFCGITLAGPYPGDPPYATAADAFVNRGHVISNNLIYDVGKRVGHGAGVWIWQSGENTVTRNYIKEAPRNGVGLYGVRFGAGAGGGAGVLPGVAYNVTLDFFSALDLLTSRDNEVSFNVIENVVRDSCDAGAVESWGVGVRNVFHTNAVSDCDSGGVDGSWMNFLFQDDASNWLNHSSNVVFNVAGKGSEEGGLIKSVFSVAENNVFAFSELGFLFNIAPYIEPAAAMTFARNIFANIVAADAPPLNISTNDFTAGTLATSCSIMEDPAQASTYNFSETTVPALSTPVILEWDYNLYWNASHGAAPFGLWDTHAVAADPQFAGADTPPWLRSVADLALLPTSPAFNIPGFRRIQVESMGLDSSFPFDLGGWARRSAQTIKVQAETYDRQVGLWREGSYGISPGPRNWAFAPGAWALYKRVDVDASTRFRIRVQPAAKGLVVALAVGEPGNVVATFNADDAGAAVGVMGVYEVPLAQPLTVVGGSFFVKPSEACVIDWWMAP